MTEQTDSHTPVRESMDCDTDYKTFVKAKDKGETTLTLRAQDVSADFIADFWVMIQQELREMVNDGDSPEQAMATIRFRQGLKLPIEKTGEAKLDGVLEIAEKMRQWPQRKIAD